MCAIAGILAQRPVREATLVEMINRMAHRGPDDQGIWSSRDGRAMLGHRRLSVIDTSAAGHQPMRRDECVLVFNGEIYNYLELRSELRALGAVFDSDSDSEVILAAWRQWGRDCPQRFNGMFAFAILDQRSGTLFCARDRYGEKPFLFVAQPGLFAFASEYKALFALAEVSDAVSQPALSRFLIHPDGGLDDGRETVFPAICQLLPGERLELHLESLVPSIDSYWSLTPDADAASLTMEDAAQRFRELLTDSVRLRLRSDVPVGSCLSGGLDSSAIVCLARRLLGDDTPYHVFTGRFPGTPADEWDYARQVLDHTGAISHVVAPDGMSFMEDLADFVWANELPVGSTSQYAQYRVFKLAADCGVTVLLDGQGADEILGGYEQYFRMYLEDLPPGQRSEEEKAIRARYPAALPDRRHHVSAWLPTGAKRVLSSLLGKGSDVRFGLRHVPDDAEHVPALGRYGHLRSRLADDSFRAHLPVLLRYGDRNSMAHAREVRLPFCDHRLAEFVLGLPVQHLMGDAQTKRLLRESMRGILPDSIRTRWNKQGFLPPQDIWFNQVLAARLEEVLDDSDFLSSGLWRVKWWRQILRRFRAGESHLAWVLWRLLIAHAWHRHFLTRLRQLGASSAVQ